MQILTDKTKWDKILEKQFPNLNDIYFKYCYYEIFENNFNCIPETIFWEDESIKVFWSHLVRDLSSFSIFRDEKCFDLTTPYGYGGPLFKIQTNDEAKIKNSIKSFYNEYESYCNEQNYVCEFIRFHPIYKNWGFFNNYIEEIYSNDVIIIDLSSSVEEIRMGFNKHKRQQIKKSINKNCTIKIIDDPSEHEIANFLDLYNKTMDKNKASKKYYFSKSLITDHFTILKNHCILIYANLNSEIIGGSLFIYNKDIMNYHLSGTISINGIFQSDLILWEAIKLAKEKGLKYFHFGGGRGKNDGLYQYKRGFSKITFPFYYGKIIFNQIKYDELIKLNPKSSESENYFPAYRVGLDETII